jgi:hypothetical protein
MEGRLAMNQLYGMWNQEYIQNFAAMQHHNQQMTQGMECVQKLRDLLNAMDKVEPAYQQMVCAEMCAVLMEHLSKKR